MATTPALRAAKVRFCALLRLYADQEGTPMTRAYKELPKRFPGLTLPFKSFEACRCFAKENSPHITREIEEISTAWRHSSDEAAFTIDAVFLQDRGVSKRDDELVHRRVITQDEEEFIRRATESVLADRTLRRRAARMYARHMYIKQAHQ